MKTTILLSMSLLTISYWPLKKTCRTHYQLFTHLFVFSVGLMLGLMFNWQTIESNEESAARRLVAAAKQQQQLADTSALITDKSFLIVCIFSAAANSDRRLAIRQSWMRLSGERHCKYYFIIGSLDLDEQEMRELLDEQNQFNDLILFPHLKDTYTSLSHKLLLTFKWFSKKWQFNYLMKLDDDSFVRMDQLFDELVERKVSGAVGSSGNKDIHPYRPIYWGYFDGRAFVKRTGQWSETQWSLCDRYLPYALGGGYIVSEPLVRFVAENSHLLQLYRNEDVSLGVWLSPLNINRLHDRRFDTEYQSRGCLNAHLVIHKQSANQMKLLYNNLQSIGRLCVKETEHRLSYEYNWMVGPTHCCHRNLSFLNHNNNDINNKKIKSIK
ncbi:beta-1,3-galactosyltransferase 6-like [Oppia nitens]|uniref:beta-1,3-galactosyltransferase 6-like n=1 Tax=Oppia nitens TaxID=1686743 RepID=UPI0023DCB5DD|nr:beta-1,3-galactosyltransferase 6-like [Oppia nitens]